MKSIWPPTPLYSRSPIESATTWPVRSISMAELMAVIVANERMTWVSLVKSTGRISTIGLSSTKSYSRWEPIRNAVTSLPRLRSLRAPVMAPAWTRSMTASLNISVWTPRSLRWRSSRAAAVGIAPMPSWMVAPSGTRSAMNAPMRRSTSPIDRLVQLVGPLVGLDREIDLVDVDEAVAEGPRDGPVELDDDRAGGGDGRMHGLDRGAQRAEAVLVGRGGVDEGHVEGQDARAEQARDVGQEDGHVVGAAGVDRGPGVGPDEQGAVAEGGGHLRRQVRARPLGVEMDDAHVAQLRRAGHQGVEQDRRRRRRAVDIDLVAAGDPGDRFGGGDDVHGPSVADGVTAVDGPK